MYPHSLSSQPLCAALSTSCGSDKYTDMAAWQGTGNDARSSVADTLTLVEMQQAAEAIVLGSSAVH